MMSEKNLLSKGIEPNVVTSNFALNASLSLGDVEDVLSVFNQILQPDSISFTLLLPVSLLQVRSSLGNTVLAKRKCT